MTLMVLINIYNKPSNNWEESIKLVIQNDLSNNVTNLYNFYLERLESILIKESLNHCGGRKINAAKFWELVEIQLQEK